jgi:hypothetical protein
MENKDKNLRKRMYEIGWNESLDEVEKMIDWYYHNTDYCEHCGYELKSPHFCDNCKQRTQEIDIPNGFINEFKDKLKSMRK